MNGEKHDPEHCSEGAGCKECKIEEQRRALLEAAKARPATARQKRDALAFLRSASMPTPKIAGLLLSVALLCGCGAPPEAIEQADECLAINARLAESTELSRDARLVALKNARAWAAQRLALTDREAPEKIAASIAAVESELR